MDGGLALVVEDAHVHAAGVEIDSTVVAVLLGVESHARPPFEVVSCTQQRTAWVALEGGPQTWSNNCSGPASTPATELIRYPLWKKRRMGPQVGETHDRA